MIKIPISLVKKFHEAYGLTVEEHPTVDLPHEIIHLRHKLMEEETKEYFEAAKKKDIVEVADALGDMLYILCGTIISHGCQHLFDEIFTEIHRSNMSKLDSKGKPIYREDGKVLKGPNFTPPDLTPIVLKYKKKSSETNKI